MALLQQITNAAAPLVATLITLLIGACVNELRKKFTSDRAQAVLDRVGDLADTVTSELEQTVVSTVRSQSPNAKLDSAFAATMKAQAVATVKTHLGAKGVSEALGVFGFKSMGELEALIASKVEAALSDSKKLGPLVAEVGTAVPHAN